MDNIPLIKKKYNFFKNYFFPSAIEWNDFTSVLETLKVFQSFKEK